MKKCCKCAAQKCPLILCQQLLQILRPRYFLHWKLLTPQFQRASYCFCLVVTAKSVMKCVDVSHLFLFKFCKENIQLLEGSCVLTTDCEINGQSLYDVTRLFLKLSLEANDRYSYTGNGTGDKCPKTKLLGARQSCEMSCVSDWASL